VRTGAGGCQLPAGGGRGKGGVGGAVKPGLVTCCAQAGGERLLVSGAGPLVLEARMTPGRARAVRATDPHNCVGVVGGRCTRVMGAYSAACRSTDVTTSHTTAMGSWEVHSDVGLVSAGEDTLWGALGTPLGLVGVRLAELVPPVGGALGIRHTGTWEVHATGVHRPGRVAPRSKQPRRCQATQAAEEMRGPLSGRAPLGYG
jgi:hypothetical protein